MRYKGKRQGRWFTVVDSAEEDRAVELHRPGIEERGGGGCIVKVRWMYCSEVGGRWMYCSGMC